MTRISRTLRVLPVGLCALALGACGKSQNQATYIIPEEGPKFDAKTMDAKATSLRLADTAYQKGEYAMAAQLYFRASELQPDKAEVAVKLGFALFKAGNPGDAEKIFRAALAKEPNNLEALRGLAHSLVTQGRAAEAITYYRQAMNAGGSNDARIYAGLGAALDMIGKHDEARAAYQNGLKLAPQDFGLRNNLALSYAMSGDSAKARAILGTLSENPAAAPMAHQSLSTVKSMVAKTNHPPARSQVAEVKPVPPAPKAETPAAARIDVSEESDPRELAEVPAPAVAVRVTRKPNADLPVADAGEGTLYITTGRASVAHAALPRTRAMSFSSEAANTDDAAAEVLDLLQQAERGPRFVWQEARRPDQS